jgi:hypothetical protein
MSLKLPIPALRKKIPPKRQPEICCDLLELLAGVSGGRPGQGRDHPVAAVLALAAATLVAGFRSCTVIAR